MTLGQGPPGDFRGLTPVTLGGLTPVTLGAHALCKAILVRVMLPRPIITSHLCSLYYNIASHSFDPIGGVPFLMGQ